jgi:hypothetical protein
LPSHAILIPSCIIYKLDSIRGSVMKHLSDQELQALDTCIEKCEEFINLCGQLGVLCSAGRTPECTDQLGPCLEKSSECITASRACAKSCQEHLARCTDTRCRQATQACIDACHGCVRDLGHFIEQGALTHRAHTLLIDQCVVSCNQAADACNTVIALNTAPQQS